MTTDALDPGPNGDYPHWPRDGEATRMPSGLHSQRTPDGRVVTVDLTPRHPDGTPVVPPPIPPAA